VGDGRETRRRTARRPDWSERGTDPIPFAMTSVSPLAYPPTRIDATGDRLHGVPIPDPYRWLEDDRAPDTAAWVAAQNAVTEAWLDAIPWRETLRARITALVDYPRVGAPIARAGWILTARNSGLQDQSVWMVQRGLDEPPRLLIDPNTLSPDGTTRVGALAIDRLGVHVAYTLSHAGSDWQEIRVRRLACGTELPDVVRWVKVSDIAWHGAGFYYSRYPEPDASVLSDINDRHQVWYHTLGTSQDSDRLVFDDPEHTHRFHVLGTTRDERVAVLSVSDRGQGKDGEALFVRALDRPEAPFTPLWPHFDDQFRVIDHVDGALLVFTTRGAPNGCVVRIRLDAADPSQWETVLPEHPEPLQDVTTGGGWLFATRLVDVSTRVLRYALDGSDEQAIPLPGLGTADGFEGDADAAAVFYTFTSFTAPPTIYRLDLRTGTSTPFEPPVLPFDPSAFETRQVFATSRDGTRIPMFLVHRRGLVADGRNPTLLYGYGGFNVTLLPQFSPARVAFLEQGGVFVQANLRGGGEYGEAWHQAGMKTHKQNVFDDAIACAEWLVAHGITAPDRLAVQGGSNGGLLVGALMTQRPDLFAVALPAVGVLDMLRFHKFTIGWNWIADYGSSDDPDEFRALLAYSPLHNLRDGVAYPATLITTGDHDDRVVPAHSFKFAARLQAAHAGDAPVLIRVETQSGHGASSLSKAIAELTDVYAFLFANLGVDYRLPPRADPPRDERSDGA
jgi:prolyl oligopeptidase